MSGHPQQPGADKHQSTPAAKSVGRLSPGPLPRESNAEPLALRAITKLDQCSMVWADDSVATQVEALGPFSALVMLFFLGVEAWMLLHGAIDLSDGVGTALGLAAIAIFGAAVCVGLAVYELKISVFNTYADLHFNRKLGKIYTAQNNKPFVMDWRYVHPEAQVTLGPIQLGAPPLLSLVLVETFPDNPKAWKTKLTVAGPLPDRAGCQQVWELIRRYMDESPASLPPLPVVPSGRDWATVLVAFGPQAQLQGAAEYLKKLRANSWHIFLNPLWVLFWFFFWPDPVSTVLYAKYRRKAKLPTDLVNEESVPPGETNPYRTGATAPTDVAGMRHAARVIGITLGITTTLGVALWAIFAWAILHAL